MADPTPEQLLIIGLVGDLDPATGDLPITPSDGVVMQHIAALWDRHADKAVFSPALRAAYVERDACELILTVLAPEVDTSPPIGGSVRLSQRITTYQARYARAQAELERLESLTPGVAGSTVSTGVPVVGLITAVNPIGPPPWGTPDANDPGYGGSPYRRGREPHWGRPR